MIKIGTDRVRGVRWREIELEREGREEGERERREKQRGRDTGKMNDRKFRERKTLIDTSIK